MILLNKQLNFLENQFEQLASNYNIKLSNILLTNR